MLECEAYWITYNVWIHESVLASLACLRIISEFIDMAQDRIRLIRGTVEHDIQNESP